MIGDKKSQTKKLCPRCNSKLWLYEIIDDEGEADSYETLFCTSCNMEIDFDEALDRKRKKERHSRRYIKKEYEDLWGEEWN